MADAAELLPHQSRVRVTMFPDRLTVVDTDEIPGLRSQGLLIEDDQAGQAGELGKGTDPAGTGQASMTPAQRRAAAAAAAEHGTTL